MVLASGDVRPGDVVRVRVGLEHRAQVLAGQSPRVVGGDADELRVHDVAGRRDRRVRPGRGCHPVRPIARLRGGARGVPCSHQRREVADRPAGGEHPACARRHPDEVGDPAQRLVLGVHGTRALEPGAGVDRGRPDDEVEHHGGVTRRARDEGQVARVVGRQAGGGEVLREQTHGLDAAEPAGGDRLPDPRAQFGLGHRAVQRRGHAHPLLGVGHHRVGQCRQLDVLVLLVGLPVHGGDSSPRRGPAGTP